MKTDSRKKRMIGVIAAVAVGFGAQGAMAQDTWYVSPSGDNGSSGQSLVEAFETIHHAVAQSTDGDSIIVEAGVYDFTSLGSLVVNKELVLLGAQHEVDPRPSIGSTRSNNAASETVISADNTLQTLFNVTAPNVTVSGFNFAGGGGGVYHTSNAGAGQQLLISATAADAVVTYNLFQGEAAIGSPYTNHAVFLGAAAAPHVARNYMNAFQGNGGILAISGSSQALVEHNEISRLRSESNGAIQVTNNASRPTIFSNYIHTDIAKYGISLQNGSAFNDSLVTVVRNNTVSDYGQGGIAVRQHNVLIEGNTITGAKSLSAQTENPGSNNIEAAAIYIRESNINNVVVRGNFVEDNTFTRTGSGGNAISAIRLQSFGNAATIFIQNNSIVNNFNTVASSYPAIGYDNSAPSPGPVDIRNNWYGHSSGPQSNLSGSFTQNVIDFCDGVTATTGSGDAIGVMGSSRRYCFAPWALFRPEQFEVSTSGGTFSLNETLNDLYTKSSITISELTDGAILRLHSPDLRLTEAEVEAVGNATEFSLQGGELVGDAIVTIEYAPADVASGEDEAGMRLHRWDDGTDEWVLVPGSTVDTGENTVSAEVSELGVFAAIWTEVPNTDPEITITQSTFSLTEGDTATSGTVALVTDAEDADGDLTVEVSDNGGYTGTISVDNVDGEVIFTADAPCGTVATTYTITLLVTDSEEATDTATFDIVIAANPAPTIGDYDNTTLAHNNTTTVTPDAPPAHANDNIVSVEVAPETLTGGGTVSVNPETGVVTITTTLGTEANTYSITVTVTDICGNTDASSFDLTVPTSVTGWMQLVD
ncbi:MAG: hypothetical protein JJU11_14950 [Candidatus Sumerlaeia bacterium]|nr:hypothetical protein [Candidatus Sumerlaeia bacterium]